MRRTSMFSLATAALLVFGVAGCSSSGEAPPAQTTVPQEEISQLAFELKIPSLDGQTVVQFGEFDVHGRHFVVGGMDGATPFVEPGEMARVAAVYGNLTATTFPVSFGASAGSLDYDAALNAEPEHIVAFNPDVAKVDALGKESGQSLSNSHTAWSAHSVDGKGMYVLTVIGDQPGPTYGVAQAPIRVTATYVELCQSMLNVTLSPAALAQLKADPQWSDDPAKNGPQLAVARQAGQEVVCNSLGLAMAYSTLGVPYGTYVQIATAARLNVVAPLSLPLIVVSESSYAALAK